MDINAAAEAVDRFLRGYEGAGGRRPIEIRALPSGDDMNAIKVWVNLGAIAEEDDLTTWCGQAESAIRTAVPGLDGITLEIRADAL